MTCVTETSQECNNWFASSRNGRVGIFFSDDEIFDDNKSERHNADEYCFWRRDEIILCARIV